MVNGKASSAPVIIADSFETCGLDFPSLLTQACSLVHYITLGIQGDKGVDF